MQGLFVLCFGCGGASGTSTEPPEPPEPPVATTFVLEVNQGFGDGTYSPGDVVHVWADVDPRGELVAGWSGDVELMDPAEWHTTFVMPDRNVSLTAEIVELPIALTEVEVQGADRMKRVLFHAAEGTPRGIVFFAHGTGGSADFIEKTETLYVARLLVEKGFVVWSTDAEEVDVGDSDRNSRIQWDPAPDLENPDVNNVSKILDWFVSEGVIQADTPRYAIGMSNGGNFAISVGTGLEFNASVSYCAPGVDRVVSVTSVSTAWFLCGADTVVDNEQALANHQVLVTRGVTTELHVHEPSPLYPERFTRGGLDLQTSSELAEELRAAGHVDEGGFIVDDVEQISGRVQRRPGDYPVLSGLRGSEQLEVVGQVQLMRAEHQMFDDMAYRTLNFIESNL